MAEITAEHGEGTARAHRAGHDGMQEGADRGRRRHRRRPRSCCASRAAPRRPRPPSRVAAEGVIGAYVSRRRQDRRDGRGELRDRLRREERGLRRVRDDARASSSPTQNPADVAALARSPSAARRSRPRARRWCRRSARTSRSAASSACRRQGKLALVRARRARSACWSTTRATRRSARTSRCTSPFAKPQSHVARPRCRPTSIAARARDPAGARRRIRQARRHRREDGRGRGQQVPGRGDAARPAVREGRQADGREDARSRRRRKVNGFTLFVVGEGIEKKKDDFAAEVAAMSQATRRNEPHDTDARLRPIAPATAGLQAHPAQALGRGADGRRSVRHQPRDDRPHRRRGGEVVAAGRAGRRRDRRRQHLPRRRAGRRGHGPRDRRLHGHARHADERAGAAGRDAPRGLVERACSRRCASSRSPSPTSAARRCATSRRARSSSSPPAPAIRSSPPTPRRRCAAARWASTSCSRRPRSTASTPPTRRRTRRAQRYAKLTFDEAIVKNLKVMDATALALCRDQKMLIKVFSIFKPGALQARRDGRGRGHAGAHTDVQDGRPACDQIADIKKTTDQKMASRVETLKADLAQGAHRPRAHRAARPHHGRLLRHADADQPGRQRDAARRAHDRRPAVGEEDGPGGREGDPRFRPRAQPGDRGRHDPRADAAR